MATKKLQGITIEIDGNTTGLSDALSSVNKKIGDVQGELRQVNQLLKLDPTNTDLLAQKQKLLSDAIKDTSSKLESLRTAKAQADEKFASGNMDEKQFRELEREVIATEQALNKFTGELKSMEPAVKKIDFKDMANKMGEIGKVAGEVALKVGEVVAKLSVALAGAVTAVGAKMISMSKDAGKLADGLLTLSAQTNVSTDTLQKWDYASKFIDTDVETMTGAMAKMTKGLDTNAESFKKLGVATKDSSGNFRSQEEIFMDSIDALGEIDNATQRDAISMQLFGRSAQELNPLIKAGSEQLRALGDEATNAGLVMGGDVLTQFGSFDDTMERMGAKMTGLKNNITQSFMPAIAGLAGPIEESIGSISKILADGLQDEDMDAIGEIVTNLIDNLISQLSTMIPKLLEFLIPALNTLISSLVDALPKLLPILINGVFTLIKGLISSIVKNIQPLVEMAKSLVINIVKFIVENLPIVLKAGIEILLALIVGIAEALPELIPAIVGIIDDIIVIIIENLPLIIDAGIQILVGLIKGIIASIPVLVEMIPTIIDSIIKTITDNLFMIIEAGITIIIAVIEGLIKAIPQLIKSIPKIITSIREGLMTGLSKMVEIGGQLISGLWEGIKNSFNWIKDKIKGWVGDVWKFIKKLFGINSPSKLMRDEIGLNLGKGMALGIEDSVGMVEDAMAGLGSKVEASVNPIINPSANSNPLIIQIENFNNSRQQDVQALAEELEFYRKNNALAKGGK